VSSQASAAGAATILVVDDDALITLNTVDIVTDLGHVALEAFSAREALDVLAAHPEVSLIITDYGMPGMSGADLAKAARQQRPGLPVLLATGYADLPDNGGEIDLPRLEKPYRQEDLAQRIDEILGLPAR
jgi:CheY-like chemotaxis protein